MRIVPLITAVLVALVLYGVVIERDRLFALVDQFSPAQPAEDTPQEAAAPAPEPVEDTGGELAEGVVGVIATRSIAKDIDTAVLLRGETEAARQVNVVAETSGKVTNAPLRKGTFVQEGQLLCSLDPGTRAASLAEAQARLAEAKSRRPEAEARIPEAEARLIEARARLEEAEINSTAASRLSQGGFASQTRVANTEAAVRSAEAAITSAEAQVKAAKAGLDSLQASVETAEAALARAQTEIDRLDIHTPFAGLLESDGAELGSLLQPGALCATVIQLDPIKIVGFVPELDVNRIEVGSLAGARMTDRSEVQGRVTFLSRSADATTRTFRVELSVPNADLALRDGQTAEIAVQAEGEKAHLLASSALTLNDEGTLGVRTIDADNLVKFIPVTVLRDTAKGIYVTGLPDQVDVITVGQEFVTDGVEVAPSFEEVIQ